MAGQLIFTLQDFQAAAVKYRKELLHLPIIGIQDTLQYMTPRPGIRYKEAVGTVTTSAQFAPYKATRSSDANLNLDIRELETFFGNVVAKFEPNSAVSTILGAIGATKGDGQAKTPTALEVLSLVAEELSEHLNDAIWNGVRNANGDTTKDLFNGFDTITETEIAAGNIAAANGNYMKLTDAVTHANALDIAKEILFSLDPKLRKQELYMYCSQSFADAYNESYKASTGSVVYNNKYNQVDVEGSNGRLHIVPLYNKADSKFIHIAPKRNMLVGFDQMGDVENVEIERFEPFILSYIATMFFGVQFESIDKRRLKVVELKDGPDGDDSSSN